MTQDLQGFIFNVAQVGEEKGAVDPDYDQILAKGKAIFAGVPKDPVRGQGKLGQGRPHLVIEKDGHTQENPQDDPFVQVGGGIKGDQESDETNDPVGKEDLQDTGHLPYMKQA